jgi:hypothetical protein
MRRGRVGGVLWTGGASACNWKDDRKLETQVYIFADLVRVHLPVGGLCKVYTVVSGYSRLYGLRTTEMTILCDNLA